MSIIIKGVETHKGLVLQVNLQEHFDNGYDTNYYALVWNIDEMRPERVYYATTFPGQENGTAKVDSHPLIQECYRVYTNNIERYKYIRQYQFDTEKPTVGDTVIVRKGTKAPKGFIGQVIEAKPTQYGIRYRLRDGKFEHIAWQGNIEKFYSLLSEKPKYLKPLLEYPNKDYIKVTLRLTNRKE